MVYRFRGGRDGSFPRSPMITDERGNFYGVTNQGGVVNCLASNGLPVGCGTIFELIRPSRPGGSWKEQVLYRFRGVPSGKGNGDAAAPNGIVRDSAGNLYGSADWGGNCVTTEGGIVCTGAVFKLAPPRRLGDAWKEHVLYRFSQSGDNNPHGGLVLDTTGNLYGTTYVNQTNGNGAVFELAAPQGGNQVWKYISLYRFKGGSDGGSPNAGLVRDKAGSLYGTTLDGGVNNQGTVFQLSPPTANRHSWTESILHRFNNSDGDTPLANLIFDEAGDLYSTTQTGGASGQGVIFRLSRSPSDAAAWVETVLQSFSSRAPQNGLLPVSGLTLSNDGALYGTTPTGGIKGDGKCIWQDSPTCGVVFRIVP